MDTRAKELVNIGNGLFTKKRSWDELQQEIAEQVYPLRADFTSPFTLGEDFGENLMDSYPVQARETLGNTIGALLRQGDWFEVKTGIEELDEDPENARYLESVTSHFRTLVYDRRAKFVRATNEADMDWVSFGNPVLSVETNRDAQHLYFRSWHPRDCAWMENDIGQIDHLQRNMPTTARTMKKRWPKTIASEVAQYANTDPTKEFKVRHIVLPFDEVYGDDKEKRKKYKDSEFCSFYIDVENEVILAESPMPVFNYVVPRWRTISGFRQAFSPASINSLPDARMLQTLARILMEEGEKAVDPPTVAKGEIFRDAVNLYAGGMTYVDLDENEKLQDVFQTVASGTNMQIGLEMKQDVRNLIAESWLLNKITLPPRGKTAYETQALLEEYRRSILPFTGPVESEYHLPLLDVAFQIAVRNRAFRQPMPDALEDQEITFQFDSPLNTAEGRQHVQAFQESIQILAGASQFDQTIPATMDFKKMTKDAVKGTGSPADWFADEETEQEGEEAIRQTQRLQQMASVLREGAGVAKDTAEASAALSEAGVA